MTAPLVIVATPGPLAERVGAVLGDAVVVDRPESLAAELASRSVAGVVYLAQTRDPRGIAPDVGDAGRVSDLCAQGGVPHLVLVSSAAVHEPSAHHLNMLGEGRLAPRRTGNPLPERWQALEATARERFGGDGRTLTVLRPSPVVTRGGRDFWSRLVSRRLAVTVPGYDPTLQLLSADDLAAAVARVTADGSSPAGGVFNVVPASNVPLHKAVRHAGALRLPVPYSLQWLARKALSPLGLAAPIEQIDFLRFPSTVSGERLRLDHGFEAAETSARVAERARVAEGARRPQSEAPGGNGSDRGPTYDPWGIDVPYIRLLGKTLFRFLHNVWWRIEVRGLHHLPREGGVVLTGVHRGFQPWDGVMAMHLIAKKLGRYIRFLVHPSLVKFPFLAPYMIRMGGMPACLDNGDWVLRRGDVLAIFPEGIRGAFRMYNDQVYELGKFGRDEFVRFALRHQVPIVPFVTIGSAEIYPIYGKIKWSWWKRVSEWPFLPVTPTLGTVPLPSKWHTHFLEPIHVEREHPPEAAEDRRLVRAISAEVRRRMDAALKDILARRRTRFAGRYRGNVWTPEERAEAATT